MSVEDWESYWVLAQGWETGTIFALQRLFQLVWREVMVAAWGAGCRLERLVFLPGYVAGSEVPTLIAECLVAKEEASVHQEGVR